MGRVALHRRCSLLPCREPVAVAAPPWSAPENVSSPSLFVDNPARRVRRPTAARRDLALERRAAGHGDAPGGIATGGARAGRARVRARAHRAELRHAAPHRTASTACVGLDTAASAGAAGSRCAPASGARTASFGAPRHDLDLSSGRRRRRRWPARTASLAAWIAKASRGRRIVRAAIKSPGPVRQPVHAARPRAGERRRRRRRRSGVMFVAWERAGVVEARVRLAGPRVGPRAAARPRGQGVRDHVPRRRLSGRRGYLAWLAGGRRVRCRCAWRCCRRRAPASARRRRSTRSTATHRPSRIAPALVPIPERDALLAWTDWDGARWRVRAAVTGPRRALRRSVRRLAAGRAGGARRRGGRPARHAGARPAP